MSVCGIIFDKVHVRADGKTTPKIARIIIGFATDVSCAVPSDITFSNKFIHYPEADVVHHDVSFLYNGIDGKTISNQGKKYSHVVDWFRASIRNRTVVVCGSTELMELIGDTNCRIIDLQNFFYTKKSEQIKEPISLVRLANRFFGYDPATAGKRDPFQECKYRIALYYVMRGFQACGCNPPFDEDLFPKIPTLIPSAKRQLTDSSSTATVADGAAVSLLQSALSRYKPDTAHVVPPSLAGEAFDQQEYYGEEEHIYENDTPIPSPTNGQISLPASNDEQVTTTTNTPLPSAGRGTFLLDDKQIDVNSHPLHDERKEIRNCTKYERGPIVNLNISFSQTRPSLSENILKGILSCITES